MATRKPLRIATRLVMALVQQGILTGGAAEFWSSESRKNTSRKIKQDLWVKEYTPEVEALEAALQKSLADADKMPPHREPHIRNILAKLDSMKGDGDVENQQNEYI